LKLLVLGGTRFLGRHTVEAALARKHQVTIFTRGRIASPWGDRVTHLVDWEISHFGDPMEDLAAICVRDMVTPFAHLPSLFAHYGEVSGTHVDLDRVRYHRVSKCVRSLFAILSFTSEPSGEPEFAIWQAWRLLYIKSACQALAEAMGGAGSHDVQALYRDAHRQVEAARPAMGALADRSFSTLT